MHPGCKCSQSRTPPYQSLITTGPATEASGKQAGKGQVSAAPAGAAGSSADRFPVVAARSPTTVPWEAPAEVASPACTALSFRKGTGSWAREALPAAGSCWATCGVGALKRSFYLVGTAVFISSPCSTRSFGVPWSTLADCWASPPQQVRASSLFLWH